MRLQINGQIYHLPRHPSDTEDLTEHGFDPKSFYKAAVYCMQQTKRPALKKRSRLSTLYSQATSWRIHPNMPGYFQLLDEQGEVLHAKSITIRGNPRKLSDGLLRLQTGPIVIKIPRHASDHADTTEHGFASGQKAKHLKTFN